MAKSHHLPAPWPLRSQKRQQGAMRRSSPLQVSMSCWRQADADPSHLTEFSFSRASTSPLLQSSQGNGVHLNLVICFCGQSWAYSNSLSGLCTDSPPKNDPVFYTAGLSICARSCPASSLQEFLAPCRYWTVLRKIGLPSTSVCKLDLPWEGLSAFRHLKLAATSMQ